VAHLRPPNIVARPGPGRTDGDSNFIAMELVVGCDLASRINERVIELEEAVGWTREICDAIAHAHRQGVVHCDLKPANILLGERAEIKVTDFGLARVLSGEASQTARVEGTVPFMAPEQASRTWGRVDHRTDVHGIGAVLFALLTGRPPFVGLRLTDILEQVVALPPAISPARLRSDLPESLSNLCRKCLSKAPEARYQNVQEVRMALATVLGGPSSEGNEP